MVYVVTGCADLPHPRLLTLLGYLAEGLSNAAISERMKLRRKTVENYTVEIYSILFGEDVPHLNRRVAAAGWYWHNNMVRRYIIETDWGTAAVDRGSVMSAGRALT